MNRTAISRVAVAVAGAILVAACQSAGEPTTTQPVTPTTTVPPDASVSTTTGVLPAVFDLQGHRGARGLKPENTLPAFETGLDLMVDTLELDLHFSADDEVVVWHDPVVDPSKCRLADGAPNNVPDPDDPETPSASLAIRSLTVEQLGWYRCDRNPDPDKFPEQDSSPTPLAGDRYEIVPLEDLFTFVQSYANDASKTETQRDGARSVAFNVETKRKLGDPGAIGDGFDGTTIGPFESRLLEVIDSSGMGGRVTIQSFDARSLLVIHAATDSIPLAILTSSGVPDLKAFAEGGATIWSPNLAQVSEKRVTEAHDLGMTVVPWTVNDLDVARELVGAGVDGLITDRPDLFLPSP